MNPPSIVLGGGVHGKVCWLIAYISKGEKDGYTHVSDGYTHVSDGYAYVSDGYADVYTLYLPLTTMDFQ